MKYNPATDDYEPEGPWDEVPRCPVCGDEMERELCGHCDSTGMVDCYEDDAINYAPGEAYEPCGQCDGEGGWWLCPQRGDERHGEPAPLSAERLAEIAARVDAATVERAIRLAVTPWPAHYVQDVAGLLADNARLRAALELAESEAARYEQALGWANDAHESHAQALRADRDSYQDVAVSLMAERNAAMEIVRVVALADNSDMSVCYQLCPMRWREQGMSTDEWEMEHTGPCVIEQARAVLGMTGDREVTTGEQSSASEERQGEHASD